MNFHLPTALRRPPIRTSDVHRAVHGRGTFGQLNTRIAVWVTDKVGSMWTAYVFALLALISLPAAIMTGSVLVIVAWIAQTFFQLVLLPVVLVGQNVQAAYAERRARDDHEILTALHSINAKILTLQEQQMEILRTSGDGGDRGRLKSSGSDDPH